MRCLGVLSPSPAGTLQRAAPIDITADRGPPSSDFGAKGRHHRAPTGAHDISRGPTCGRAELANVTDQPTPLGHLYRRSATHQSKPVGHVNRSPRQPSTGTGVKDHPDHDTTLAPPVGVEPTAVELEARCSIR